MRLSMLKFMQGSEEIISNGGFSFVKKLLDSNTGMSQWDLVLGARHNASYSTSGIVRAMVGLMTAGECDYASIGKFRNDWLFRKLSGESVPSEATFRQRLDALAQCPWQASLDACTIQQLAKAELTRVNACGLSLIPVDIDVSVLEDTASHKEGVEMSYHQVKGYAPIFCYAGHEGFMVANELRPGSQHSEKGAVDFLKRCIGILTAAGYAAEELLVRVDSGHDSSDFIKALCELNVKFIVKRNLRKENPEQLMDSIRSFEKPESPRPGKTIYRGIRSDRKPVDFPGFCGFLVVEGTERTSLADGQELLLSEVEVDSWWTNLPCGVRECVALYHDHGTSEQFHSELKSDLGIELLPSGSQKTNALILGLATLAYNCLRFIGQTALSHAAIMRNEKKSIERFRLRTVLLDYIKVGCKIISHAGLTMLKFGRNCYNFLIMKKIYDVC